MPFDYQRLVNARASVSKKYQSAKTKLWDDKANRIALLFLIAALLTAAFVYYQYARRHYAISASSRRSHNQQLKEQLDRLNEFNRKIKALLQFQGNTTIDQEFKLRIKKSGVADIQHEADLLTNCSQQFDWDQKKLDDCKSALDQYKDQIQSQTNV